MAKVLKHFPIVIFLVAAFMGAFSPIHEFFHLVSYYLETGRVGEMAWFYSKVPGGGEFSYGGAALFESLLCGVLFIFGNRWLKYYGFSEIMVIIVFWYGSSDYQRTFSAFLMNAPMVISITLLTIGVIKIVKEADDGQSRAN